MSNKHLSQFYRFIPVPMMILLLLSAAQAQSGGQFRIEQSVIAGGGETNSTGGQFSMGGTTGQAVAGQTAASPQFTDHAGFWQPAQFTPTAAMVSISGRITTADGSGIRNVQITLTGGNGVVRSAQTGSFGNFRFDDVEVEQTYFLQISSKRYIFAEPIRILSVQNEIADIIFVALPQ